MADSDRDGKALASKMKGMYLADEYEIIRRRFLIDGEGTGDEKRLLQLIQTYVQMSIEEELTQQAVAEVATCYKFFTKLMQQCDGMKNVARKTYHLIEVNIKARKYWTNITEVLRKELADLRTLMTGQKQKLAEINLIKKMEESALLNSMADAEKRGELEKKVKELEKQRKELEAREAELTTVLQNRKQYADTLCDLAKRLTDDSPEVMEQAVKETEEKGLSDISMDLD